MSEVFYILPPDDEHGLRADEVENDRFIRCLAPGCTKVWNKFVDSYADFESHMHVHEMADGLEGMVECDEAEAEYDDEFVETGDLDEYRR